MSRPVANARWHAVRTIGNVVDKAGSLAEADETGIDIQGGLDPRDAAFARHLAYGVIRWLGALEWLAARLLDRPLKRKDQDIQRLILLGLFQLWKDETAPHAAINETAECARTAGKPWAVGLVNAVLRRFQRERADWLKRLQEVPERFAHPQWLVDTIRGDWPGEWERILDANNRHAGLWLRINRTKTSNEQAESSLAGAGYDTRSHRHASDALEVIPPAPVEQLPGFGEGAWSVQDPAAQLAADWLEAKAGERILDACAAPGGKTCHILETVPDSDVLALDRSRSRLDLLEANADRLGLAGSGRLTVRCGDAAEVDGWWDGAPFDRILLDAPCTATGVIRRHPEIKWLRTPAQVEEAVALQARILHSLWPLLKAGGILVYATCSVLRDENSQQIRRFLESQGGARTEPRDVAYGQPCGEGHQILPGEADMDGFFYARLRKAE